MERKSMLIVHEIENTSTEIETVFHIENLELGFILKKRVGGTEHRCH